MSDAIEHELNDGTAAPPEAPLGAGGALEDGPPQAAPAAEDPAPAPPAEHRTETRNAQRPAPEPVDQAAELELRGRLTELEHKHNAAVDALSARAGFALVVGFGALIFAIGLLYILKGLDLEGVQ